MCSLKRPQLLETDAAAGAMLGAVTLVAERSFFAVAERCDERRFAEISNGTARWMVATVRFSEADCAGTVSCTMTEDLAHSLFDAFAGRDALDPVPGADQILDLVGEFSNMVCGSWLTRLANHQTFTLARPAVQWAPDRSQLTPADVRLLVEMNDAPLAVEVRFDPAAGIAAAGAEG